MRTRTAETGFVAHREAHGRTPFEFVLSEKRPVDRAGHRQIGAARYPCCMAQAVPTYSEHVAKG